MKRIRIWLPVFAVAMLFLAGIKSSWAYFTTYTKAKGGYTIELGNETKITEEFDSWTKKVSISSKEGSQPVYIRVKAFCGSEYELVYSDDSGKWTPGEDGYYYYSDIVNGGETTNILNVRIENVPKGEEVKEPDSFQVVVVYESTPVQYHEDGTPFADWSVKVDTGTVEGGMVHEN